MRAVAACGGATRASHLPAGVHAHAHAHTCRRDTHTHAHVLALALASTRPTLRRLPFLARHVTPPLSSAAGQTRGIQSSYKARDHSTALANLGNARAQGGAPPRGVWLDDFQCFQDDTYYRRYDSAPARSGYLKAVYTAKYSPISKSARLPILITYARDCVPEDAEFWPEIRVLLSFAKAMNENDMDANNRWRPNATDFRTIEFIYVMSRFHYSPREPGEPWHTTVCIGSRHTWKFNYVHSSFHVYAKNENLADGYGGYSLTNLRDDANAAFRMPQSLFPDSAKTQCIDGYFVRTKYRLGNRASLAEALNTEIPIPDGDLWDPFRPRYQKLKPGECFRVPGKPGGANTKPRLDGDKADLIVKAFRKWCEKPVVVKATGPSEEATTDDEVRSRPQSKTNLHARIQQAIADGDKQVIDWALKHYTSSEVHTVGGSVRRGRADLKTRYKLQPQPRSVPAQTAGPLPEPLPSIGRLVQGELVKAGRLEAANTPRYKNNRAWLPRTRKQRHLRPLPGGGKALRAPRMSVRDANQHKKVRCDRREKRKSARDAKRPQKAVKAEATKRAQSRQTKNVAGKIISGQYDPTKTPGKREWASPWTFDTIKHIVDGSFTPDARQTAAALRALLRGPRTLSGAVDRRKAVHRTSTSKQPANQSNRNGWVPNGHIDAQGKHSPRTSAVEKKGPSTGAHLTSEGTHRRTASSYVERDLQAAASTPSARWAAVREHIADVCPSPPTAPNRPSPQSPPSPSTPSSTATMAATTIRTERPEHDAPRPPPFNASAATRMTLPIRAVPGRIHRVADDGQGSPLKAAQAPPLPPPWTPSSAAVAPTTSMPIRAERPWWDPKLRRGRAGLPVQRTPGDESGPAAEPSPVIKRMFRDPKVLRREIDEVRYGAQTRPRASKAAGADKSAAASVAQQPVQREKHLDFVKGWIQ